MGASAYVGRVGKLAVALGVGTAVFTGHGVASADDADPSPPDTSSSSAAQAPAESNTPVQQVDSEPSKDGPADPAAGEKPGSVPSGVVSAQTNTGSTGPKTRTEPEPKTGEPEPATEPEPVSEAEPEAEAEPEPEVEPEPDAEPAEGAPTARSKNKSKDPEVAKEPATAVASATQPAPEEQDATSEAAAKQAAAQPDPEPASQVLALSADEPIVAAARTFSARSTVVPQQPAVAPADPLTIVTRFVSNVVDMVLGPIVGGRPAAPADPPLAWTLLAYARRELDNFVNAVTGRTSAAPATEPELMSLALAAASVPRVNVPPFPTLGAQLSPSTQFVNWVTGNYQQPGVNGQVNPLLADTLNRFGVDGTDVGTMWDNGIADDPTTPYNEHQVLIAFGDTFGVNDQDWRFNVLMRSSDAYLADGMDVPPGEFGNGNWFGGMPLWDVPPGRDYDNYARRIINPEALPPGVAPGVTLIPTAGIALPSSDPKAIGGMTQYLSFMSVRQWGTAGQWTTNYSGIAYSIDNGENWKIAPQSIRYNDPYSGNANFQQAAFVRPGDGYVYAYGTPNGRQGAAYLSRVAEKDILDVSKYEYWSKGSAGGWFGIGATPAGWKKGNPAAATAVFGGADQGACGAVKPGVQVSELSVQYNKQLKKYVTLYGDQSNNIVMRTSDTPQGTWSDAKVLITQQQGGIYAPMMHPWSPSTLGTGTDLYWNLSLWSEYNVMLMKTDLSKV